MLKKIILGLSAWLLVITIHADIIVNPKVSTSVSTNNPTVGFVLTTDGQFNYWGPGTPGPGPATWSIYPATCNLNMGGYSITNIGNSSLIFNDGTVINSVSVTTWNSYTNIFNVTNNTFNVGTNAAIFNGPVTIGGVTRTNWPTGTSGGAASEITNDSSVAGATVADALNTLQAGTLLITENGPTSILYHVTSGGHTNLIGYFYSDY